MAPTLVVSAPGKVIVHGEHAVVFGKRALAASLGLRTTLTLVESNDKVISLNLPNIGINVKWCCDELQKVIAVPLADSGNPTEASDDILSRLKSFANFENDSSDTKDLALVAFLYLFGCLAPVNGVLPGIKIDIQSLLPTSAGLGSSAAFSVCLAAGFLLHSHLVSLPEGSTGWSDKDLELINGWAFMSEKVIHGRPSGIDNSISTYGGALWYQGGKIMPVQRIPNFHVLLVNTKLSRSTKVLVEKVRLKYEKYPEIVIPVLDSIEAITNKCESTLQLLNSDVPDMTHYRTLEELIEMNQQHLAFLGVSHPALDQICQIFRKHLLHAKLTGAGGGGCAFALIPPDCPSDVIKLVTQELTSSGFDCFETCLGGNGVRLTFDS